MGNADLIREVRKRVDDAGYDRPLLIGEHTTPELLRLLADALERAKKERDALEGIWIGGKHSAEAERECLRAENERLVAVIAELDPYYVPDRKEPE